MLTPREVGKAAMLAAAAVLCVGGCASANPEVTARSDIVDDSSSAEAQEEITADVRLSTTTNGALDTTVPDGGVVLVPDGPYADGQEVTLLASSSERIDLYNSSPRLCAQISDEPEVCDPSWVRPRPIDDSPAGTQGVVIELAQTHFGPSGNSDCAEPRVQCRLIWRTEAGRLFTSDILGFTGVAERATVSLEASSGGQPGVITVSATGVDNEMSVDEVFSPTQLQEIEHDVGSMTRFDPSRLQLDWHVGGLCGFGPGDPPRGTDDLASPPSWWTPTTLDSEADPSVVQAFVGTSCDSLAVDRPTELRGGEALDLVTSRHIYGFSGWIDCAIAACWVQLIAAWSYPMPDGSTLGDSTVIDRVLVEVSESWPTRQPTITVTESGPYTPGQEVTVEVHDHPFAPDGLGIGWCPGGDNHCAYRFGDYADGVYRATWQIPLDSTHCESNRCFFAIDNPSEGLAPPAIVVVPVLAN